MAARASARRVNLIGLGVLVACLVSILSTGAAEARRVALVIGNSGYQNVSTLTNPANDAAAIAETLRAIGFDAVEEARDLDQTAFRKALRTFTSAAAGAETALIYYAGHGVEVDGRNFLVPVDATLSEATDTEFEAIPLESLRTAVSGASNLRLVILDACRNNPFKLESADGTRSIGRGLARVEPGANEVVAYAAREGTVAADGEGGNSPYATSLIKHLKRPGLDVRLMFGEVRDEETARTAMQAAMTGHLVFSTVHAKDTIAAVFRLLDLKVEPYLVANSLDLVLAQRLVRHLCEHCKQPVRVSPGQATRLGKHLHGKTSIYSATGCTRCLKTGFRGRRAIFELLDFTDELRDVVLTEPTIAAMKKVIEGGLFTTLAQFGWRLVAEGITTLDEVDQVAGQG